MKAKFYICEHCGNLVTTIHNAGVPLVCCGEQLNHRQYTSCQQNGYPFSDSISHPAAPESLFRRLYENKPLFYDFFFLFFQRLIQLLRPRQRKPSTRDDLYTRSIWMNRLDRIQLGVRDCNVRMAAKICLLRVFFAFC